MLTLNKGLAWRSRERTVPPSAESSWPPLAFPPKAPGIGGLLRYSFTLRQCSSSLSVFGSCKEAALGTRRAGSGSSPDLYRLLATNLHPEEEPLGSRLELQYVHAAGRALRHPLELAVIGENDQILEEAAGGRSRRHRDVTSSLPEPPALLPSVPKPRGSASPGDPPHPGSPPGSSLRGAVGRGLPWAPHSRPPRCPRRGPSSRSG